METLKYHIGIDPGWKNLGFCLVKEDESGKLKVLSTKVFDVSSYTSISKFVDDLDNHISDLILGPLTVTIERYVAYAGVSTAETENISMVIGALSYYFGSRDIWNKEALLVRAIDWKTTLVKCLFKKKGFDNPSDKLDKKFSLAAAIACVDEHYTFETDHEADAACLACYQSLTSKGTK